MGNNSYTTPEKTKSKESLSTSALDHGSKKPVEGTPRTSTPEPRKSAISPPVGQQSLRGFHHESILSKVESYADRRKPFYVSIGLLKFSYRFLILCYDITERGLRFRLRLSIRDFFFFFLAAYPLTALCTLMLRNCYFETDMLIEMHSNHFRVTFRFDMSAWAFLSCSSLCP